MSEPETLSLPVRAGPIIPKLSLDNPSFSYALFRSFHLALVLREQPDQMEHPPVQPQNVDDMLCGIDSHRLRDPARSNVGSLDRFNLFVGQGALLYLHLAAARRISNSESVR